MVALVTWFADQQYSLQTKLARSRSLLKYPSLNVRMVRRTARSD